MIQSEFLNSWIFPYFFLATFYSLLFVYFPLLFISFTSMIMTHADKSIATTLKIAFGLNIPTILIIIDIVSNIEIIYFFI